jgi:hypothetical protein
MKPPPQRLEARVLSQFQTPGEGRITCAHLYYRTQQVFFLCVTLSRYAT